MHSLLQRKTEVNREAYKDQVLFFKALLIGGPGVIGHVRPVPKAYSGM